MSRILLSTARLGVIAALLSATAALAQEAAAPPPPPPVSVAKPVVRDVIDADEFIGRFEAVNQVAVRSRIDGYLDQVHFKDGALVKKGDALFTTQPRRPAFPSSWGTSGCSPILGARCPQRPRRWRDSFHEGLSGGVITGEISI